MTTEDRRAESHTTRRFTIWHLSTFVLLAMLLTIGAIWLFKSVIFPSEFTPVALNPEEQKVLEQKLEKFDHIQSQADRRAARSRPFSHTRETELTPEAYSEQGASREIRLSEKELNALVAKNSDLATRLAIDLSDDLASAILLVHFDEGLPILGGNTVKLTAGAELAFAMGEPIVKLKGISIWGVPLPNAWLGGIKNVDLVQEFGQEPGFWQAFAEGVELVEVKQGHLVIKLKP